MHKHPLGARTAMGRRRHGVQLPRLARGQLSNILSFNSTLYMCIYNVILILSIYIYMLIYIHIYLLHYLLPIWLIGFQCT